MKTNSPDPRSNEQEADSPLDDIGGLLYILPVILLCGMATFGYMFWDYNQTLKNQTRHPAHKYHPPECREAPSKEDPQHCS